MARMACTAVMVCALSRSHLNATVRCLDALRVEHGEVGVFERSFEWPRGDGRRSIGDDAGMHAVAAMSGAADEMLGAPYRELGTGHNDFPDLAGDVREQRFGRTVSQKLALRENGDVRRDGFDI